MQGYASEEIACKDEVYAIIGAAFEVYNTLGHGFLEAVYQESLAIELALRRIPFRQQKPISVTYKGRTLNTSYYADFICYSRVVVEIKAVDALISNHESQLLNYLQATRSSVGLLINFGISDKLEWKRLVL